MVAGSRSSKAIITSIDSEGMTSVADRITTHRLQAADLQV
jgi:hypothetical protein